MNKIVLMGRLTRDPEVREGQTMVVTKFSIAVDRNGNDQRADFINCVAFGKTAEFVGKWFNKGNRILVDGKLHINQYEKNGVKTSYAEVAVDSVEFCEPKQKAEVKDDWADPLDDEGLPFG